ncbi:6-phospho-alpha-glucosidase [Helcococcus kunzii]|uniref:family 4 glycosyl hydrolase n=1 Tax=Helcococcus kunzii TaxID=40091 RepID=UPI001C93B111|nr:6-phospho-alpha-glucosidase [Helcococcus kunzii]QZO76998.1 6-phospho-alpha-glucosidase [Helcococcus kunzii]
MEKQVITIAGGGSTFTPGIVGALFYRDDFPVKEIRLYDNNKDRNQRSGVIVDYIIKQNNLENEISLVVTEDPEVAFTGVNFIFCQLRVGLMKMREKDEKIPLKYDLVGQETCGLGGFSYGLRSIGGMLEIAEYVTKYCPDAWILNYTNPEAIIAEAINRKYPKLKIINACDMTISIMETIAENYDLDMSNWEADYYGLNHFGWFTKIYDTKQEKDIMPELLDLLVNKELKAKEGQDPSWNEAFSMISYIVKKFPGYIPNNYLEYYLFPDKFVERADKNYTRANEVMDGREKMIQKLADSIKNGDLEDNEIEVGVHGKYIVDIASSILNNRGDRFILIVRNNGIILNFRSDSMIEVPVYVNKTGPEPVNTDIKINDFHKGLMEKQNAAEQLLLDGFFENSSNKVLEAFTLNATCPSADLAQTVLDEFIVANGDYWPKLK